MAPVRRMSERAESLLLINSRELWGDERRVQGRRLETDSTGDIWPNTLDRPAGRGAHTLPDHLGLFHRDQRRREFLSKVVRHRSTASAAGNRKCHVTECGVGGGRRAYCERETAAGYPPQLRTTDVFHSYYRRAAGMLPSLRTKMYPDHITG